MRGLALLIVAIVAAWAVLPLPSSSSAAPTSVGRMGEVRSVALEGRRLPAAQLREVLGTRAGEPLSREQLARDRAAMEGLLAKLGYLAAKVEPATVTFDAAGAAYVSFEIAQGAVFHVRRIDVTGPGREAGVVTLAVGDVAIGARIEAARQALADALAQRSRPATVELSVRTDVAAAAVDVALATR